MTSHFILHCSRRHVWLPPLSDGPASSTSLYLSRPRLLLSHSLSQSGPLGALLIGYALMSKPYQVEEYSAVVFRVGFIACAPLCGHGFSPSGTEKNIYLRLKRRVSAFI